MNDRTGLQDEISGSRGKLRRFSCFSCFSYSHCGGLNEGLSWDKDTDVLFLRGPCLATPVSRAVRRNPVGGIANQREEAKDEEDRDT